MTPRGKEKPVASPTAPEDGSKLSELPRGNGLKDSPSTAPSDGDGLSGPSRDWPAPAKGALDLPEEEKPAKPSEGEGLSATQGGEEPVGTPDEGEDWPPQGPEVLEAGTRPHSPASTRTPRDRLATRSHRSSGASKS